MLFRTYFFLSIATGLLLSSVGCSGDPPDGTGGTTTTTTDTASSSSTGGAGGSGGAGGCRTVALAGLHFDVQDDVVTQYLGAPDPALGGPDDDPFFFQLYNVGDFIDMPTGTFDLAAKPDDNYGTCGHCFLLAQDGGDTLFFQSAGTLVLENNPILERDVHATISGLRMVEVTLDPETQASTPVPGGACLVVTDIAVDYKYLPDGWTCPPEKFRDGATCDCGCGAPDADCDAVPALPVAGCASAQVCVAGACTDTCSTLPPTSGCAAGVCSLGEPDDLCYTDPTSVAAVGVGATCPGNTTLFCDVAATIAGGVCDRFDRADGTCRATCHGDADCDAAAYERCFPLFAPPSTKGFCSPRYPADWTCSGALYQDGAACDCDCGAADPDCQDHTLPVNGCASGDVCVMPGLCAPAVANDTCATAAPLALGTTTGTTLGALDDYATDPTAGACVGYAVQAGPDVVYRVDLGAGQTLHVQADSTEIDVGLYVFGPGAPSVCDPTLAGCDVGSVHVNMGETLAFTAPQAGTYYVVVDSPYIGEPGGAFTLTASVQ